jgi:DNA topoisomerase-1
MVRLIIVESPAKCQKIEEIMGYGYKCIATCGHIREATLKPDITDIHDKSVLPVKYKNISSNKKTIDKLKQSVSVSQEVFLACDADREGERMCFDICHICKLDVATTPRIIFNSITNRDVQKAFECPGRININIVHAQQCRQIIDLFIGFYVSPMLWKHFNNINNNTKYQKGGKHSAGRCQTPALRIVYDNQKQIDDETMSSNPYTPYYIVKGYFTNSCIPFTLYTGTTTTVSINTKEKAIEFLNNERNFTHIIERSQPVSGMIDAPLPFKTSILLQVVSNLLKITPSETMKYCKELYEKGHITYIRTDAQAYSLDFLDQARQYISNTYGHNYIPPSYEPISLTTSESHKGTTPCIAHEAIRPTCLTVHFNNLLDDVSEQSSKIYKIIWERTVQSCMPPALIYTISASVSCHDMNSYSGYQATFDTIQPGKKGWKIVCAPKSSSKSIIDMEYSYLSSIPANTPVSVNMHSCQAFFTVPTGKLHLTEANLIQKLEKLGIGRPSTFASFVDKIQDRKYVKCQTIKGVPTSCVDLEMIPDISDISETETIKLLGGETNKLIIQPIGKSVSEYTHNEFDMLFNYEFTANMEKQLDEIAQGEKDKDDSESPSTWHDVYIEYYNKVARPFSSIDTEEKCEDNSNISTPNPINETLDKIPPNKNIIREITSFISIRKSKRGDYIYFKPPKIKKPKFFSLDAFSGDYLTATDIELRKWIKAEHGV